MKNWREGYIKVAKGNKLIVGLTTKKANPIWWDFSDNKPVFVYKGVSKKK